MENKKQRFVKRGGQYLMKDSNAFIYSEDELRDIQKVDETGCGASVYTAYIKKYDEHQAETSEKNQNNEVGVADESGTNDNTELVEETVQPTRRNNKSK